MLPSSIQPDWTTIQVKIVREWEAANGSKWVELSLGKTRLGIAQVVDGGFRTQGHRKQVQTVEQSAKQLLTTKLNLALLEIAEVERLLRELKKCGA